jgi:hypothetical protein
VSTKTIHQPTDLRAGDTATIEGARFKIEAPVTEAYYDTESGVVSIRLDVGQSMGLNVGPGCDAKFVSATREVPEWKPGQVVLGHLADRPSFNFPTFSGEQMRLVRNTTNDGWYDFADVAPDQEPRCYTDAEITNIFPAIEVYAHRSAVDALVAAAHTDRVLYGDTTPDQMRRAALRMLAVLGIEVQS